MGGTAGQGAGGRERGSHLQQGSAGLQLCGCLSIGPILQQQLLKGASSLGIALGAGGHLQAPAWPHRHPTPPTQPKRHLKASLISPSPDLPCPTNTLQHPQSPAQSSHPNSHLMQAAPQLSHNTLQPL